MKARLDTEVIAMRVAKEFHDGDYVNLGFGIGADAASYIPPDKTVFFHSEQGILGFGRILTEGEEASADFNLTNAGGQFVAPQRRPRQSPMRGMTETARRPAGHR